MAEPLSVKPIGASEIFIEFSDGIKGTVALTGKKSENEIEIPVNSPEFNNVSIHPETKNIVWGNGAEVCKNASHSLIQMKNFYRRLGLKTDAE